MIDIDGLEVWNDDGTGYIKMVRASKKNALLPEVYAGIKAAVLEAEADPSISEIAILGGPEAFATGGDLHHVLQAVSSEPVNERLWRFEANFSATTPFSHMLMCEKPIVAVVRGLCMAGGMILAMASDVVIADRRASFAIPEARVGLADPWVPYLLPLHVGGLRAKYMMLTGASISAETAHDWGLVTFLVDGEGDQDRTLQEAIEGLRRTSPDAKAAYKRAMELHVPSAEGVDIVRRLNPHNINEGLAAFSERREPRWRQLGWPLD